MANIRSFGGKGGLRCGFNDKSGISIAYSIPGKTKAKAEKNAKERSKKEAEKNRKKQISKKCTSSKCGPKKEKTNKTKKPTRRGSTLKQGNTYYANADCEWEYTCECPEKKTGKSTSKSKSTYKSRRRSRRRR